LIKFFKALWEALCDALSGGRDRDKLRTVQVEELPDALQTGRLYLLGSGSPWSAAMVCPCGCGEVIHISLLKEDSPSWTFNSDSNGMPTLSPSVWRTKGCRSHFFIRRGDVVWCKSDAWQERERVR
jgi:hypothetical protein